MNINASIIDQQVARLASDSKKELEDAAGKALTDQAAKAVAFVVMVMRTMLELDEAEALETLTEGGGDFGVDALHIGDVKDGDFVITLCQAKYDSKLGADKNFPQSGVEKMIQALRLLFDPAQSLSVNPRLAIRLEETRSLISDGFIPRFRVLLCNNGLSWKKPEAQELIDALKHDFADKAEFAHVNHDTLVSIQQATRSVDDSISFAGRVIVEDLNYARVFIGKVAVTELERLLRVHGDKLLERNIRRYLGLEGNRVNEAIAQTLMDEKERANFYFYNNGVTLICNRFDYNAAQREDFRVAVRGLQIVNGGQTTRTVQETLNSLVPGKTANFDAVYVLVRLYQVPAAAAAEFVPNITRATNSQTPVDLKDLRSNDMIQRQLEMSMKELGYDYRRKRGESYAQPTDITIGVVAEAVLSIWRQKPQQAKFRSGDHFNKLYRDIFESPPLNAAQAVIAVLLFRIAENERRRKAQGAPEWISYGTNFIAMLMGRRLLRDLAVPGFQGLDHHKFAEAQKLVTRRGKKYYDASVAEITSAMKQVHAQGPVSLQRQAATFRRGDLHEFLKH